MGEREELNGPKSTEWRAPVSSTFIFDAFLLQAAVLCLGRWKF